MTTHEYAKLLLKLEDVPLYITEQKEYYFEPKPPEIVEGPDPFELIDKMNECAQECTKRELDAYKREEIMEQQERVYRATLPKTRYAIVEINIYM